MLDDYLREKGVALLEGHSQNIFAQQRSLQRFASQPRIQNILEIGFNGGHSAELFLISNPKCHVTSFDLGENEYVKIGKEYIDKTYPGRHTLILGNSVRTIPETKTNIVYDLIFIDGGHDVFVAIADLLHCKKLAHAQTLVLIDDTMYTPEWVTHWTVGPTHAWQSAIQNGIVKEIGRVDYERGRGMSWGKYIL